VAALVKQEQQELGFLATEQEQGTSRPGRKEREKRFFCPHGRSVTEDKEREEKGRGEREKGEMWTVRFWRIQRWVRQIRGTMVSTNQNADL
jgi:hypothetical protein